MIPRFEAWASIPRLYRDIVITEKIDGTNGIIYVSDDLSTVIAGSRSRWLVNGDDNQGFARWVAENQNKLRELLGPGTHYGEWWGAGIQRRYGLKEKRFSLFNAVRWEAFRTPPETLPTLGVVPILASGPFSDELVQQTLQNLREAGSYAAPDFMDPEGIVVFHTHSRHMYKVTLKGDQHKGQ